MKPQIEIIISPKKVLLHNNEYIFGFLSASFLSSHHFIKSGDTRLYLTIPMSIPLALLCSQYMCTKRLER